MRPSNRTAILDAAQRVLERDGLTDVTFEAVAAESGLTKGGLLYHFRSKDDLLLGLHEHLAGQWEDSLQAALGKPLEDADEQEKAVAYVRASSASITRAELLLMLDAATRTDFREPWDRVSRRWVPVPDPASDAAGLDRFIGSLAADGLWFYDAIAGAPLDDKVRRQLTDRIARRCALPDQGENPDAVRPRSRR
jgi:AcrR family transcriptional regulator